MSFLLLIQRSARAALGPVLGFCVMGYFAYHSFEGERGLYAYLRLTEEVRIAREHRDDVRAERIALERRVALLRADTLDRDMLDEQTRTILNYTRPDELVILEAPANRR
ncbi:MAG: septum formation initiator family protein [Rhodospirillales bacterium]|nr:septum formation initiator family protein [Rhodospirillales bacterium]